MKSLLDSLESKQLFTEFPKKMVLQFPTLWSAAPVLAHYANILMSQSSTDFPILWINPHQWFYCARPWSEEQLIVSLLASGHTLRQCIIHRSAIGNELIKTKFSARAGIAASYVDVKPAEQNLYVAVLGDYIVYASFTDELNRKLDLWFQQYTELDTKNVEDLREIIKHSGTVKLIFKYDPKTALQYQKRMGKFFV